MPVKQRNVGNKLIRIKLAYLQLFEGAHTRLDLDNVYWTERLLLRLVRALAGWRSGGRLRRR